MRTNSRMKAILERPLADDAGQDIPADTQAIIDAGWIIGPQGALLLKANCPHPKSSLDPSQVAHYEYDINDLYVTLTDLRTNMDLYLPRAVRRGLSIAQTLLLEATELPGSETLVAVVSMWADTENEDFLNQGVRPRFFTRRGAYPRWFDDLEPFKLEAIALLELPDISSHRTP